MFTSTDLLCPSELGRMDEDGVGGQRRLREILYFVSHGIPKLPSTALNKHLALITRRENGQHV